MLKQYLSNKNKTIKQVTVAVVVLLVAGVGTILLLGSHAANPYASVTADSGTLNGNAVSQPCNGATGSNSDCVVFGGSSGSSGQSNCLQLQNGSSLYPVYSDLDACGYPSPDTAGVPAGTTLTTVTNTATGFYAPNTVWTGSELAITGPTTINDLNIPGTIYFVVSDFSNPANADVTIENSKVQAAPASTAVIDFQEAGNVTIKNTQVSGVYSNATTCSSLAAFDVSDFGTNDVLDHDSLTCAVEPVNGSNFTLTNSYVLVDGTTVPSDHVEDVFVPGGTGATIKDDTLLNPQNMTNGTVAGIFGGTNVGGPMTGLKIENNLIGDWGNNGAITIGCSPENGGSGNDVNTIVTGNRLSDIYNPSGFAPGNTDGGSGITWSGNYMDSNPADTVNEPVGGC